jgi:chromosome partitioning protein
MTQIISAIQRKGGAGKSTLLCCLAARMAADGARTLVVDADPQGTCIDWANEQDIAGVDTLAHLDEDSIFDVLDRAKTRYDAVFVDTAGYDSRMASYVIQASDLILIPSGGSKSNVMGAARTWKHAAVTTKNNRRPPDIRIVFWGVKANSKVFQHAALALREAQIPMVPGEVSHLTGFDAMTWNGGLPEGAAAKALGAFMATVQMEGLISFYNRGGEGAHGQAA